MKTEAGLQALSAAVEEQAQIVESCADPATRSAALELVRSVMELHKAALERVLAIARQENDGFVAELARDPAVEAILLLHDLHPQTLEARIERALIDLKQPLQRYRAEATLIEITEQLVRVRINRAHHCAADPAALQTVAENALTDAAPDAEIVIEIAGRQDFVPITALQPAQAAAAVDE
jgi:hypothetical protein